MARRIELIAALLACVLGLIWLVSEVSSVQSLWVTGALLGSGGGRPVSEPLADPGTALYFGGIGVALVGVVAGAYLHVVQRLRIGLILLWLAATVATVSIALFLIEPWHFVSALFLYFAQITTTIWFDPLAVLAVVSAWVAAVAGVPIRTGGEMPLLHIRPWRRHGGAGPLVAP